MKVRKSTQQPEPGYPSRRQFPEYKQLLGAAAIGLTAMTVWAETARTAGVPVRLRGEPTVEPQPATPASATGTNASPSEPNRVPGAIAVMPRPAGAPPVDPQPAASNQQVRAACTVKPNDRASETNRVEAVRLLGEMPAQPR